jgi:hypothetical protein
MILVQGIRTLPIFYELDVDILKIDGSLIRNIDTDTNAQTIFMAVRRVLKTSWVENGCRICPFRSSLQQM